MGIYHEEIWKCHSCGYEFVGDSGIYEADPNDFGTTHVIKPYYCPKCHVIKNLSTHLSIKKPQFGNEHLIHNDSKMCEKCKIEMKILEKPKFAFLQIPRICPKCGRRSFLFVKIGSEIWT